jgi:hypothetical protein
MPGHCGTDAVRAAAHDTIRLSCRTAGRCAFFLTFPLHSACVTTDRYILEADRRFDPVQPG